MRKFLSSILLASLILFPPSLAYSALSFDAADDICTCGTSDILPESGQAFTFGAWINPATLGESNAGRIIGKETGAGVGLRINMMATSTFQFIVSGSTSLTVPAANNSLTLGSWQPIIVTYDGVGNSAGVHIYVNGSEVSYGTKIDGVTLTDNAASTISIGNRGNADRTFDGQITEPFIVHRVISDTEIAMYSNSKIKRIPLQFNTSSSLKAYWPCDSQPVGDAADGDTLNDITGNGVACTCSDGANNTGMTWTAENILSYPGGE